jgi:hypothetical protein
MPLQNICSNLINLIKRLIGSKNLHLNHKISEKCEARLEKELDIINILKN